MEEIKKTKGKVKYYQPEEISRNKNDIQKGDLTLLELLIILLGKRKEILKWVLIFGIIGLFVAIISPVEYETEVKLLPEISTIKSGGMLGRLSGLASLGGFNLNQINATDAVRPDLYPDITKSLVFGYYIMNQNIYFDDADTSFKVFDYIENSNNNLFSYLKKYTIGIPFLLLNRVHKKEESQLTKNNFATLELSNKENVVVKNIQKRVNTHIDLKSGIISLKVKMPDPYIAAYIADISINYLTDYITRYRLEKALLNLEFIEARHAEAEKKYRKAQLNLARFRDQNKNIISAMARSEEELLQYDFNLAFDLFNNLALQLEQARITVQEETPVFKVLQPPSVSVEKSEPNRMLIVLGFLLTGFISPCLIFVLQNQFGNEFKNVLKEKDGYNKTKINL